MIIGFCGPIGAGKTTAADYLVKRYDYTRVRFAGPLKAMLRALGLTEAQVDGDLKESPCELLGGKTPRWAMQTLGTEWGRDLIHPDLWTRAWRTNAIRSGPFVVADDVRFPNEAKAIEGLGGIVIRIERTLDSKDTHKSELHNFDVDHIIENDAHVELLARIVDSIVGAYKTKRNCLP